MDDRPAHNPPLGKLAFPGLLILLERITVANTTVGHRIAVKELVDKVNITRKFRGPCVYPIIQLSSTAMKTKWGVRQRPSFVVTGWHSLDDRRQLEPPRNGPVTPPSPGEIIDDKLPY
jgi:hypothetical protein